MLIEAKLANLPPGIHGFHIHEVSTCDHATGFESAGGHLGSGPHGFMVGEGPHAGDLANQTARDDGTMLVEAFNERVSFDGEMTLFDDDGVALVVHAAYLVQAQTEDGNRVLMLINPPANMTDTTATTGSTTPESDASTDQQ